MAMKLTQASVAKQNAAFDAVFPEIEVAIQQYVPPMFQYQVLEKLRSAEGRRLVLRLIDDGLAAAEKVQ